MVLTDLSRAYDCLHYGLIVAILHAHGFGLSTSLHSMHLGPKIFGVHFGVFAVCGVQTNGKTFGVRNLFSSWRAKPHAAQA